MSIFDRKQRQIAAGLQSEIETLKDTVRDMKKDHEQNGKKLEELMRMVEKQRVSLEDSLDLMSEFREDMISLNTGWSSEFASLREHSLREKDEMIRLLLPVIGSYHEQLKLLAEFFLDDPEWNRRFLLIEEKLKEARAEAGVSLLGRCGEVVNYDLHEILDVRETDQQDLNHRIAHVYETGYIFQGYIKKARAAAWKYAAKREDADEQEKCHGNDYRN